jgi:hypothetical protein
MGDRLKRRSFLGGAGAMVLGLTAECADVLADGQPRLATGTVTNASVGGPAPVYVILGVPFRTGGQPRRTTQCCGLQGDRCGRPRNTELSSTSLRSSHQELARSADRLGYRQRKDHGNATAARTDSSPDWMRLQRGCGNRKRVARCFSGSPCHLHRWRF